MPKSYSALEASVTTRVELQTWKIAGNTCLLQDQTVLNIISTNAHGKRIKVNYYRLKAGSLERD